MTADGYTSNPPSGGGGGSVAWTDVTGKPSTFPPSAHSQAASTISDSTATGRSVLTAVDAAAARTAIGAGTSSLALGATGADAAAGNHGHAIADTSGLQTALDAKSATGHTHTSGQVTDLTESVQDTVGAMVVAGTNVTTTYDDGAGTLTIAAAGGGGGSTMAVVRQTVTSGNVTPQASVPWAPLTGGPTLAIAAAVGDYVQFEVVSGMWDPGASFLDWAVMVGGSAVRYLSTDTATPATEGAPCFYADPQTYHNYGPVFEFEVESGDLEGGNVTIGWMTRSSGGGTLFANTDYPLRWRAMNHGAVTVS